MLLDLHVHTDRYSACSHLSEQEMLSTLTTGGLSGVCLTEHERMREKGEWDLLCGLIEEGLLFQGVELYFPECEVLLYGVGPTVLKRDSDDLDRLLRRVDETGGAAVLAHPFRYTTDMDSVCRLLERYSFHGVEVENGGCGQHLNRMAETIRERMGLSSLGGSDAHGPGRIGVAATLFEEMVESNEALARAIRAGRCKGVPLRV